MCPVRRTLRGEVPMGPIPPRPSDFRDPNCPCDPQWRSFRRRLRVRGVYDKRRSVAQRHVLRRLVRAHAPRYPPTQSDAPSTRTGRAVGIGRYCRFTDAEMVRARLSWRAGGQRFQVTPHNGLKAYHRPGWSLGALIFFFFFLLRDRPQTPASVTANRRRLEANRRQLEGFLSQGPPPTTAPWEAGANDGLQPELRWLRGI